MRDFIKATGARIHLEGVGKKCQGVSTDSRTIKAGELFFALHGPHFDGHRFCDEATHKGAWGLVVEEGQINERRRMKDEGRSCVPRPSSLVSRPWVFQVRSTLTALGDLAAWWRRKFSVPCIGITGSNGKTTTKEMVAGILMQAGPLVKTEGNFNNLIGLPLTVSRLGPNDRYLVLEMGMNMPGEIARLTDIAAPEVGCITNVAPAHLEKLGSVEHVAHAKGELFATMDPAGTIVVNAEDPWIEEKAKTFRGKKIRFGLKNSCDVQFEHLKQENLDGMELKFSVAGKRCSTHLPVVGLHNVMNALAAASIALALNIKTSQVETGLARFRPLKMRLEQVQLSNGVRLVNDSYNANPASMESAFRTVGSAKRAGRFLAVLGDMLELGGESAKHHLEIGRKAVQQGVQKMFLTGNLSKEIRKGAITAGLGEKDVCWVADKKELASLLERELKKGDVVLVKASRGMGLETIADFLKDVYGM